MLRYWFYVKFHAFLSISDQSVRDARTSDSDYDDSLYILIETHTGTLGHFVCRVGKKLWRVTASVRLQMIDTIVISVSVSLSD